MVDEINISRPNSGTDAGTTYGIWNMYYRELSRPIPFYQRKGRVKITLL